MPTDGTWPTIHAYLVARFDGRVRDERIDEMFAAGEIVDLAGPVAADTPYRPGDAIWFHRDLPDEPPVPFSIDVLHRDEAVLVVDKPHFLATIPRGRHVLETALVRLRHELDLPRLVPAHRLDRATAGVLLFVVDPAVRGAYQQLFAHRRVHKVYEAIAAYRPDLDLPRTVRSRIVKLRQVVAAFEEPGEPNSETLVELHSHRDGVGRYRLTPTTGRTHQLRLHLESLGIPILGDDLYPTVTDRPLDDFTRPLQLLARTLAFADPITGEPRRFDSNRTLSAWTDPDSWTTR
ncbi:pseudouridine synthase [Skermania piniformis]|uniref:RNA pseudouridylate synthase n=1 Tax=Skermania pinensis TaxID=39122 RepID=A0ABX8S9Y0_9ACTN|nr:pseudouridine synthase [Skermania piniformis]QXQ14578.1 pseudouridylate synthase [Skermania piniformis]